MARTAFVYHPDLLQHDTGDGHPERRARLQAILQSASEQSWWDDLLHLQPKPASREALLRVHSAGHLNQIEALDQVVDDPYEHRNVHGLPANAAAWRQRSLDIFDMFVTLDVFQLDRSPKELDQLFLNIPSIFIVDEVVHPLRFALKTLASWNI